MFQMPIKPLSTLSKAIKIARLFLILLVFLTTVLIGCSAGYSGFMGKPLKRLARQDYAGALARLEKPSGSTNKLLYRLEKGLILHYQGQYDASNREFSKAERLIDKHYTRSASREIAAFVTNDAIRAYSGEEYERVLIHYYRAMNYIYLHDPQGALVECRKANLRLQKFATIDKYNLSYQNDAFIQYMTGLLFEAEGELNDAYISYKDALKGYQAYNENFNFQIPRPLILDLTRLTYHLGYMDEVRALSSRYRLDQSEWKKNSTEGEVIIFVEHGFIARKRQKEITIPLLANDSTDNVWKLSDQMLYRYNYHYPNYHYNNVDYWLKMALPYYQEMPSRIQHVRLSTGDRSTTGIVVEDLNAIARKTLEEKENTILLRTLGRALTKYMISKKIEEESDVWGTLFQWFGVSTEAADTRSWLSLPERIQFIRFSLPSGTVDLSLEFLNARMGLEERVVLPNIEVPIGKPLFLKHHILR